MVVKNKIEVSEMALGCGYSLGLKASLQITHSVTSIDLQMVEKCELAETTVASVVTLAVRCGFYKRTVVSASHWPEHPRAFPPCNGETTTETPMFVVDSCY